MLYDIDSQDPPELALLSHLYEAAAYVDSGLKARAKFMRRSALRYPELADHQPIPERQDGITYLHPEHFQQARRFVKDTTMNMESALHHAKTLGEQEKVICAFVRLSTDSVVIKGLPLQSFFAFMSSLQEAAHIYKTEDVRMQRMQKNILRYIDNAIMGVTCQEQLMLETYGKNYPALAQCPGTPFDLALRQWVKKHPNQKPGAEQMDEVQNGAYDIFDTIIAPYKDALPNTILSDTLGVIGAAREGVARQIVANDEDLDISMIMRFPFAKQRAIRALSDAFSRFPDVDTDYNAILQCLDHLEERLTPNATAVSRQ